jgi:hypothetical protein
MVECKGYTRITVTVAVLKSRLLTVIYNSFLHSNYLRISFLSYTFLILFSQQLRSFPTDLVN